MIPSFIWEFSSKYFCPVTKGTENMWQTTECVECRGIYVG
jgi:hypothetical protein